MIYAIDFDGTLCEEAYPKIGRVKMDAKKFVSGLHARGDKWILFTMREGAFLWDAVQWLKSNGFPMPDAVNDNLPEKKAMFGENPRKIYADVYIDDHNAGGLSIPETVRGVQND